MLKSLTALQGAAAIPARAQVGRLAHEVAGDHHVGTAGQSFAVTNCRQQALSAPSYWRAFAVTERNLKRRDVRASGRAPPSTALHAGSSPHWFRCRAAGDRGDATGRHASVP